MAEATMNHICTRQGGGEVAMTRAACAARQKRAMKKDASGKWGTDYALRACLDCDNAVPLNEALPPRKAQPKPGRATAPAQPSPSKPEEKKMDKTTPKTEAPPGQAEPESPPADEAPSCKCGRGPQVLSKGDYYMGMCHECMSDNARKAAQVRKANREAERLDAAGPRGSVAGAALRTKADEAARAEVEAERQAARDEAQPATLPALPPPAAREDLVTPVHAKPVPAVTGWPLPPIEEHVGELMVCEQKVDRKLASFGRLLREQNDDLTEALAAGDAGQIRIAARGVARLVDALGRAECIPGWEAA